MNRLVIYGYFILIILVGSIALYLPLSWNGEAGRVSFVDALFTAVSAACVTGLATLDTAMWSRFGQVVLLILIQAGGLGIVTFGMLYLFMPHARLSLKNTRLFKETFAHDNTSAGRNIIKGVLVTTLAIETVGAVLLTIRFYNVGVDVPIFSGIFFAISAFCNSGFSLFSDNLIGFQGDVFINLVIMLLMLSGGIGFFVISDIVGTVRERRRVLLYNSRLVILATATFVLLGFFGYLMLESRQAFMGMSPGRRVLAALFQSVATGTSGFNTIDQTALSPASTWLTMFLMFVGGGSGSTAGGIKVTTAFILMLVLMRGINEKGDLRFMRRRVSSDNINMAAIFCVKAMFILFIAVIALGVIENPQRTGFSPLSLAFESFSALGTVGLSTGITPYLSTGGKIVLIITMFTGRVGLFTLVVRGYRNRAERMIEYPKGEVFIG